MKPTKYILSIITCFTLFLFVPEYSYAQLWTKMKKVVKGVGDVVETGTETLKEIKKFKIEANRTTKEFNKNVKVRNGQSGRIEDSEVKVGRIANGKIKGAKWEPVINIQNEIFPSAIVSLASYKGKLTNELEVLTRPIGFRIISKNNNFSVRWEIECVNKDFFDKVSGEFVYENRNDEIFVMPEIPWNHDNLIGNYTAKKTQVIYRFFDEKGHKIEKVQPVNVRSITDCLWRYRDTDLSALFTAYVQENHPKIDELLRSVINTGYAEKGIIGYQGDADDVLWQVLAVWRVLHELGFEYSSITTPSAPNQSLFLTQSVRTFDSAIKTAQANCVDGSVVFASILRKMGIESNLVLVPGHCFISFYTGRDKATSKEIYLETTLLSSTKYLKDATSKEEIKGAYMNTFALAVAAGQAAYDKYESQAVKVNLSEARRLINSIPIIQ